MNNYYNYRYPWGTTPPPPPIEWICPKCGKVYSPTTPTCFYCGGYDIASPTTDTSSNKNPLANKPKTTSP